MEASIWIRLWLFAALFLACFACLACLCCVCVGCCIGSANYQKKNEGQVQQLPEFIQKMIDEKNKKKAGGAAAATADLEKGEVEMQDKPAAQ